MLLSKYLRTPPCTHALRLFPLWLAIGVALLLTIGWFSLAHLHVPQVHLHHGDKLVHFFAYLVVAGWFTQLFCKKTLLFCLLLLIGYGSMLEVLQSLVPYRSFDYWDMLANSLGIASAGLASQFIKLNGLDLVERKLI